jgi:hypothetical protein
MDEISIDRLVLDLPGLTLEQAKDVAERVGQGLADADARLLKHTASYVGDEGFDALSVDLNDNALNYRAASGTSRLADAIVASLLKQMGRS